MPAKAGFFLAGKEPVFTLFSGKSRLLSGQERAVLNRGPCRGLIL